MLHTLLLPNTSGNVSDSTKRMLGELSVAPNGSLFHGGNMNGYPQLLSPSTSSEHPPSYSDVCPTGQDFAAVVPVPQLPGRARSLTCLDLVRHHRLTIALTFLVVPGALHDRLHSPKSPHIIARLSSSAHKSVDIHRLSDAACGQHRAQKPIPEAVGLSGEVGP